MLFIKSNSGSGEFLDSSPAVSQSHIYASVLGTVGLGDSGKAPNALPSAALLSLILIGYKIDDWG